MRCMRFSRQNRSADRDADRSISLKNTFEDTFLEFRRVDIPIRTELNQTFSSSLMHLKSCWHELTEATRSSRIQAQEPALSWLRIELAVLSRQQPFLPYEPLEFLHRRLPRQCTRPATTLGALRPLKKWTDQACRAHRFRPRSRQSAPAFLYAVRAGERYEWRNRPRCKVRAVSTRQPTEQHQGQVAMVSELADADRSRSLSQGSD